MDGRGECLLDATANPLLIEGFFDETVGLRRIDIEQNAIGADPRTTITYGQ